MKEISIQDLKANLSSVIAEAESFHRAMRDVEQRSQVVGRRPHPQILMVEHHQAAGLPAFPSGLHRHQVATHEVAVAGRQRTGAASNS